jgi:hypothetical protein
MVGKETGNSTRAPVLLTVSTIAVTRSEPIVEAE